MSVSCGLGKVIGAD